MKNNYYVECEVKYKNDDEFDDTEYYSFIVNAKNKNKAQIDAKARAKHWFEREIGKEYETEINVVEFYLTSDDARTE